MYILIMMFLLKGILHLCNQTLRDWYSKGQATIETVEFGLLITAASIGVDQVFELKTTLRYLGDPENEQS
jgi:hypothetical protein